jgi:D-alanyl-D-alanine carboxypeptidase
MLVWLQPTSALADRWTQRQPPDITVLAAQLARDPRAVQYGPSGTPEAIFGLPLDEARRVYFPVSHTRGLPDDYVPPDLVNTLGRPLRALIVQDFREMDQTAERSGAYISIVSAYRSAEYQAVVFEQAVQRQLARPETTDRAEAEMRVARFIAPPGHSQHQLGTTADLSSWEIGYGIRSSFGDTVAGRWLVDHAWEFGFIIPYTSLSEPRTGYAAEPWHLRWVGRTLAAFLWDQDYLDSPDVTTDEWMLALEQLQNAAERGSRCTLTAAGC